MTGSPHQGGALRPKNGLLEVISGSLWLPLRFDTLDGGLDTLDVATCNQNEQRSTEAEASGIPACQKCLLTAEKKVS